MKDALKNISQELAEKIVERFQSDDIKRLLADTKAASEAESGIFEVVITTENLDRYQEVIKLDGWETERYLANPVVLWGHDHNRIIGMATSLEVRDGKMIAKGKFAPTEEGQEKRQLYDAGFLRATSVGFMEKEREGNLITKAELLEFSFVSVPANPYALSLAMERDFSVNELVTKGIMFVEKSEEAENEPETAADAADEETAEPEEQDAPEGENEPQERDFSTKQLSPVIDSLKAAVIALEALGTKSEEPEGDDAAEADTEEERKLAEFNAKRKLIQEAATVIGDILAEARQALKARGL